MIALTTRIKAKSVQSVIMPAWQPSGLGRVRKNSMKSTFASFVKDRHLVAALAYEMLNRERVQTMPQTEVHAIASALLAESPSLFEGVSSADEFLQRACATGLLVCEGGAARWQSARTQTYLAALRLYWRYRERNWQDKEQTAAWLQTKAALSRWREPIIEMRHHVENKDQAARLAELLAEPSPWLASQYRKHIQAGWFDTPWFERGFLAEIAWPLGDISFWLDALNDWDSDTRRQAALVLGTARVAESKSPLLGLLHDGDDQVRAWAAWALGRLGSIDAITYLIALQSDPSRRVRFQVRRALALIQEQGTKTHAPTPPLAQRANAKILVSDDYPETHNLYRLILERKGGYTLLNAPGGEQTLELARREQPDLITTDIMNIHMPGIDLVFQLRNDAATRDTPILLASAHNRHWPGFFGGADAFVQLPFGPEELLALVDEMLLI